MVQTMAAPERSYEQRMDALQNANVIRVHRADLKKKIKRGERDARMILRDPHAEIETMKLFDLLLAMPKIGRVKANKVLQQCRISPSKTVGGLSVRQRGEILGLLGRR